MSWQLLTGIVILFIIVVMGVIGLRHYWRLANLLAVDSQAQWQGGENGLLLVNKEGQILKANGVAQARLGSDIEGQFLTAVLPGDDDYQTIPLSNWLGQAQGELIVLSSQLPPSLPPSAPTDSASTPQIIPYKVLRAIGELLEPEAVAYVAVQAIADLTQWPTVAIAIPDDNDQLVIRAAVGVPYIDEGVNGRAFRTGHTQIIPDPNSLTAYYSPFTLPQSALVVPLRRGRKQLGVLNIESDKADAFNEDDVLLAESLADAIVLALDNAHLFTQAQNRLTEQSVLREAMSIISATLDYTTVLNDLAEQMGRLMQATSVYICSYDSAQISTTVLAEYYGERASEAERVSDVGATYYLPDDFPGTRLALEAGEPLLAYVDDPTTPAVKRQHLQLFGGYTSLLIPLQIGGKTIAYAEVWESQQRRTFTPSEIQLCQDIAYHAAVALENARLFKAIADERGRLQALIESDRDGIILVGETGQILVMNEPARAFLELAGPLEQWIHQPAPNIIGYLTEKLPVVAQIAIEEQGRIRQGDTQPHEGEIDSPARSIHWRSLPVVVEGRASNRLIVLRDITEERQLEQMREDLIHTTVHDLRNPLTSISITLDLLGMYIGEVKEEKVARTLARARSSTLHMLSMVNEILDINRLESGRLDLAYQAVTFASIINPVLEMQLPLALENNIQVTQDIPPDLPIVRVDAALVERVMQNLIGNAIKFTPSGGTVRIRAEVQNDHLLVSVMDTGAGIPQGLYSRLFQKFSTGDQQQRGSGLGLAFCKMAIEAHRQRIWVADTSPKGTTFQFTLPLA